MAAAGLEDDAARARVVAGALTAWFHRHRRDLPWRRTRDPYAIWVSEVMLQQTRVEAVCDAYERFLERFPTLASLAAAPVDEVLAQWSGLGYYRRARLLHAGAREVMRVHGGRVPDDPAALRALPGVGPYTAGALSAIAFDRPEPLVDGNVARVLTRLDRLTDPADQRPGARLLAAKMGALLRAGRPRVVSQAVMELGALVCGAGRPACGRCPVADRCRAHAAGRAHQIPAPRRAAARPRARFVGLVVVQAGGILLVRRPERGLLAGLFVPPLLPTGARVRPRFPAARAGNLLGGSVVPEGSVGPWVRHVFTHRVWEVAPWRCRPSDTLHPGDEAVWWRPGTPLPGGLPSLACRILAAVGVAGGGGCARSARIPAAQK